MSKLPLISVAMTTYNGESFLREQLDSIIAQTYVNIEIIICDDVSTDGTLVILEEYSSNNITYYVNDVQLGVVKNFEKVLSLCNGKYIALADQDDIWDLNKLEVLYENIGKNLLIHSDARLINQNNKLLSQSYYIYSNKKLRRYSFEYFFNNDVTGCTVLINQKLLEYAIPFPDDVIVHDWWLALCASNYGDILYLEKPLISYRQHQNNQLGATNTVKISKHSTRFIMHQKKLSFLQTLRKSISWEKKENYILNDLIDYYQSYFNMNIRVVAFCTHLKYFRYFHDDKNMKYRIFGLFLSLFGYKIQQRIWSLIYND